MPFIKPLIRIQMFGTDQEDSRAAIQLEVTVIPKCISNEKRIFLYRMLKKKGF
jgi:hypothetical protein